MMGNAHSNPAPSIGPTYAAPGASNATPLHHSIKEEPTNIVAGESSKRCRTSVGTSSFLVPVDSTVDMAVAPESICATSLFPGLPDEVGIQCLAWLRRGEHPAARQVCKAWRSVLSSTEIFTNRRELGATEEWLYVLQKDEHQHLTWRALDPVADRWTNLPAMPEPKEAEESADGDNRARGRWCSFFRFFRPRVNGAVRDVPFCGCTPASINGSLYVIGGFAGGQALKRVLRYSPSVNRWEEAAPLGLARAFCMAGTLDGKIYVVGGVAREGANVEPLPSGEVLDPAVGEWQPLPRMPFSKSPTLPASVLSDSLRPTATGLAVVNHRICVTQSLYHWPFFVDIGGEIYDPTTKTWTEMPQGMGEGWPVKQGGTKVSAVVGERLYGLDPHGLNSGTGGLLRSYDPAMDAWRREALPPLRLEASVAEAPYLLASLNGRLYVMMKDAARCLIVSEADVKRIAGMTWLAGGENVWRQASRQRFGPTDLVACEVVDC
eukprot:TRINITY_DN19065_c0_g1_i1.p1 TRINITY_DN19065_c0_g1~~TRINITY_DN19065_c0_g1_i1.p1  ORF type:complete len:492 (-),score=67.81 TRINITY_DN19065_c0_g1_i1:477-1952(-)